MLWSSLVESNSLNSGTLALPSLVVGLSSDEVAGWDLRAVFVFSLFVGAPLSEDGVDSP